MLDLHLFLLHHLFLFYQIKISSELVFLFAFNNLVALVSPLFGRGYRKLTKAKQHKFPSQISIKEFIQTCFSRFSLFGLNHKSQFGQTTVSMTVYFYRVNSRTTVADLRGALPWPKIFSISCSFSENLANSYVGAFPWRVRTPSYGRGIMDPPLNHVTKIDNIW